MANLRGGTFEKQIKDAFHRVLAFGEGRHLKEDNLTHSLALAEKREMYLKDFKEFLEQKGIQEGKLNQFMSESTIKEFLNNRISDLKAKTALDYVTGFNSLLKGLEQANITIKADLKKDFLADIRTNLREEIKNQEIETNRAVENLEKKLQELYEKSFYSGVVAELQSRCGFRVSEAQEIVKNFSDYYNKQENKLSGVIGKGNHTYKAKEINYSLALKIQKVKEIKSYNSYLKDLKSVEINKSHNLRYSFVKENYKTLLEKGLSHKEVLKTISEQINHNREEITEYYLKRN
jgi:hypothetical protein